MRNWQFGNYHKSRGGRGIFGRGGGFSSGGCDGGGGVVDVVEEVVEEVETLNESDYFIDPCLKIIFYYFSMELYYLFLYNFVKSFYGIKYPVIMNKKSEV